MNDFDGLEERVEFSPLPRKRGRCKELHQRERDKKLRHSGGGKVPQIGCNHTTRRNEHFCNADLLTANDLAFNHATFYDKPDKVAQDQLILTMLNISSPKRRRIAQEDSRKKRDIHVTFSLLTERHPEKVKVCKATFVKVLGISRDRVSRVARYYAENAKPRPENRGGVRNADEVEQKRQAMTDHIKSFTCRASHYGRRGAPGRKYLPTDLCVKKMHELFLMQNHVQVSYSLYYSVFTKQFNLGFGHPVTDVRSTCAKHKLEIKDPEITQDEKRTKTAMFILHRRRARVFYDLLGQPEPDAVTVCFDMMQNMALPKTAIGQAYYSRQLYLYLFGVVVHHGKDSEQPRNDVHLYTWLEHQNKKDSNMIASALYDCFCVRLNMAIRQKQNLRLFSDSCYGQNKNMTVVSMLHALRKSTFPNLRVEYAFPIRGHSFLPADRVFGRIEQQIRKQETILLPEGYYAILSQHGILHVYGDDWQALDFKSETHAFVRSQRSFKLSDARMLLFDSDQVGFKARYAGNYCYHTVLKRGRKWVNFRPGPLDMTSTVKEKKKEDVEKLLAEIGAPEDVLQFYSHALRDVRDRSMNSDSDTSQDERDNEP